MLRWSWSLAALLAVPALLAVGSGRIDAQTVVVTPAPVVRYYAPPVVVTPAPVVRYYAPPVVVTPAPVVRYYSPAPVVVTPAPATVTTYRYRVFPRRVVVRTYSAPAPVVYVQPQPVVRYYQPAYVYP
jgi:hypothetical protein